MTYPRNTDPFLLHQSYCYSSKYCRTLPPKSWTQSLDYQSCQTLPYTEVVSDIVTYDSEDVYNMSPQISNPALNQRVAISPRVFSQPVGYHSITLDEGGSKRFHEEDGERHVPICMEILISHMSNIETRYSCLYNCSTIPQTLNWGSGLNLHMRSCGAS